jgi:hypothetical protein
MRIHPRSVAHTPSSRLRTLFPSTIPAIETKTPTAQTMSNGQILAVSLLALRISQTLRSLVCNATEEARNA